MRSPLKSWAVSLIVAACGAAPAAAQNAFPGADWQQATPQSQGVDPVKLQEATTYLEGFGNADQSIVVIRNGYLISKSSNIDNFHQVWSCTKSFTSTVLGLLIDDGRCTLDTPAKDHLAVLASNYPDVRLRHFATMTSGYQAAVELGGTSGGQSATWWEPGTPRFAPGTRFEYLGQRHESVRPRAHACRRRTDRGALQAPDRGSDRHDRVGLERLGGLGRFQRRQRQRRVRKLVGGDLAHRTADGPVRPSLSQPGQLGRTAIDQRLLGGSGHVPTSGSEPASGRQQHGSQRTRKLRLQLVDERRPVRREPHVAGRAERHVRRGRAERQCLLRDSRMEHGHRPPGNVVERRSN